MASLWRRPVLIQKHRQLTVCEGEKVATVEVGSEGPINTHDTLRMKGVETPAGYIGIVGMGDFKRQG